MNSLPRVSLEDSLYVLQLARETALAQNRQAQAKRMAPVVEEMRNLAASAPVSTSTPPSTGMMGQPDFKALRNYSICPITWCVGGRNPPTSLLWPGLCPGYPQMRGLTTAISREPKLHLQVWCEILPVGYVLQWLG
jgi:hypothetical protein